MKNLKMSKMKASTKIPTVCVQGLGFVGAAMATAVALSKNENGKFRYNVIGVELPTKEGQRRVDCINRGEFPLTTVDEDLALAIKTGSEDGNLAATTDQTVYQNAQFVIIDVALDISITEDDPRIDFSVLEDAVRTIGRSMRQDALVVVETTVAPGTCEHVIVPILQEEFKKRGLPTASIQIAHSYERVMPGKEYLDSIINDWRVYSGYTTESAKSCRRFLETIINTKEFPLTELSTIAASETAKIIENSYRATNIAFIDEWTKFSEKIGIDLYEVIRAIAIRPTHSNIRYPGVGVGGYCLTKDPIFAPAAAAQIFDLKGLSFPFVGLTKDINQRMPCHVVDRLEEAMGNSLRGKEVLICGVSYRPDIGDSRFSPSETLVWELKIRGANVLLNDPVVGYWEELEIRVDEKMPERKVDGVILAVAHSVYRDCQMLDWLQRNATVIVDAVDLLSAEQRYQLKAQGLSVNSIGRGSDI